ncbi:hypothetical protein KY366_01335 [Candidatus Woesearchaeota archaeon]|nr:hypothetical protein [Candidatus Woesearchaeota archaeon]
MLDDTKIERIRKLVPELLNEGLIKKSNEYKKLTQFFIGNAQDSLNSAKLLFEVSTNNKLMELTGFRDFKGYLWAINASYYSMYYMANALLASEGIKIASGTGVHKITFNTFTYYFYLTGKITKNYIEEFLEAQKDSEELLGKEEIVKAADIKAKKLIDDLASERRKRSVFTYELKSTRIEAKAKTSIERAQGFIAEIMKMLK